MARCFQTASVLALSLALASPVAAQSTSTWIRVGESTNAGANVSQTPSLGATYVWAVIRGASVYQNSNWWTQFVERNRQAVVEVSLEGQLLNTRVSDTRTSRPIELRRDNSNYDFGYSATVVQALPTTFQSLQLAIGLTKSAQDGLGTLLASLGELSMSTPALNVSQASMGVVSATKAIADFLFQKRLIERRAQSTLPLIGSGPTLQAGTYAILAGDSQKDYLQYLQEPPGRPGLRWNGSALTWDGKPLQRVSYFVVEISYTTRIFQDPINSLTFAKGWTALYQVARRKVDNIKAPTDTLRIAEEIRSHLAAAQTLLDGDIDYVQRERDEIHTAIKALVQKELDARIAAINAGQPGQLATTPAQPSSPSPSQPTATPTPSTVLLTLPDSADTRQIIEDVRRSQRPEAPQPEAGWNIPGAGTTVLPAR